jgi:hypothetical protein
VPAGLKVDVVLDNSSMHKASAIQNWLLRHPRFDFHFTPISSSWMNLVERWFAVGGDGHSYPAVGVAQAVGHGGDVHAVSKHAGGGSVAQVMEPALDAQSPTGPHEPSAYRGGVGGIAGGVPSEDMGAILGRDPGDALHVGTVGPRTAMVAESSRKSRWLWVLVSPVFTPLEVVFTARLTLRTPRTVSTSCQRRPSSSLRRRPVRRPRAPGHS